ncbi:hypothetical protein [Streptomyces sp. NPDC058279]|uniref:hypothetical protein n=1 Tax=Streptomyces sp. NPDC058279 TaxID=3346418 RepID=UPI0036E45304
MSRTAHHVRSRRRAGAARAGRRPRPSAVRRRAVVRRLPRVLRDRSLSGRAAQEERRARQRLRLRLRLRADARTPLRRTDRGRDRRLDLSQAADTDIRPARHRRAALWLGRARGAGADVRAPGHSQGVSDGTGSARPPPVGHPLRQACGERAS